MGKVATFEQIVDKARAVHGDRYEYVQLIKDTGEPIKIVCVCPAHGQFTIRAARHYTEGKGCPKCSTVTSMEEFLHRANSKHGKRYDYSRVQFTALSDKVDIVCEKHGVFTQKAGDHIRHYGCPKCGIEQRAKDRTKDTEWFISKAKSIHGEVYDYSRTVYVKATEKLTIICKKHGEFKQQAIAHTSGQGCPTCGGLHGKTTALFIADATRVHGSKYIYTSSVYAGALEKVAIECKEHGVFEQIASNHLCGSGCPQCSVTGFDPCKPAILYYLKIKYDDLALYKIGITNLTVQERFSMEERKMMEVLSTTEYAVGSDAYKEEQAILNRYSEYAYKGKNILKSGNTELFTKDILGDKNE